MLLNIVENIYVGAHQHRFQNFHMEVIHPNLEHPSYLWDTFKKHVSLL